MPKVSIIVPVYNVEDYLSQCLNSLLAQTEKDIEIICVDDGSTDKSLMILRDYAQKDKRISLFQQKNQGAGVARNLGLAKATGEYLLFLDADDFFSNKLVKKAYTKCIATDADIGIYRISYFEQLTKSLRPTELGQRIAYLPRKDPFSYRDMPDYIFYAFENWTWNKIFKRSFILRNQINFQPLHRTNDLYFTCTALVMAERITTINAVLAYYRWGVDSQSQATNHKYPVDFYYAFKQLKIKLHELSIYNELERSYINWALMGCIYNLNSIKTLPEYENIYNLLKTEIFSQLEVLGYEDSFYYEPYWIDMAKKIMNTTVTTYLFDYIHRNQEKLDDFKKKHSMIIRFYRSLAYLPYTMARHIKQYNL